MKKIIATIVLMLITSVGVYAEETTYNTSVKLYEDIQESFVWSIPANFELDINAENPRFNVGVSEAHIAEGNQIDIKIKYSGTNLKSSTDKKGPEIIMKKNGTSINNNDTVLIVNSVYGRTGTVYNQEITIEKYTDPFQYAGRYSLLVEFEASIVPIS